jgi:hypothetical protein
MSQENALRSDSGDDPVYVHKPSLMGAAWELRLRPDVLEWHAGRHQGHIAYGRIARIRLSYRPVTMAPQRFVTEIWPREGARLTIASTTWRSMIEQARQDQAYGAFIRELHRRIVFAGAAASFETGSPPVLYWPGLAVFTGAGVAIAALTVRALQIGAFTAAAFVGAFLVVFLWQSGAYFRRNRPGRYRPDDLPADLVPDA